MMMIGTGLIIIGILLMFLLNKNSSAASSTDFSAVPVEVDYESPELNLNDLTGAPVSLSSFQGKIVLVNLWATWCPPCREEMPALQAFYEKYKNHGFVLIGINQEEARDVVQSFVKEFGLSFPVWLDEDYLAQRVFNTVSLPSSYLIDRKGRVRLMWIGGITKQNLEKYLPVVIME
jgi:thiol-disulfide isomerase/thioredoxin